MMLTVLFLGSGFFNSSSLIASTYSSFCSSSSSFRLAPAFSTLFQSLFQSFSFSLYAIAPTMSLLSQFLLCQTHSHHFTHLLFTCSALATSDTCPSVNRLIILLYS